VEFLQPPGVADFEGFPDAPTLHRLRQVSDLHITDGSDPDRIATNTGRYCAGLQHLLTSILLFTTAGLELI